MRSFRLEACRTSNGEWELRVIQLPFENTWIGKVSKAELVSHAHYLLTIAEKMEEKSA